VVLTGQAAIFRAKKREPLQIEVSCDLTPSQLVSSYGRFEGRQWYHLQGQVVHLLDPEDEGTTAIHQSTQCRRLKSSAVPL
jgi:hypothetical protein